MDFMRPSIRNAFELARTAHDYLSISDTKPLDPAIKDIIQWLFAPDVGEQIDDALVDLRGSSAIGSCPK